MNRLKEKYLNEVVPSLMEKYNYKSKMEVPKLEKIVINIGVGDATSNSKLLDAAVADLAKLSGQKPVVTKAKKSIAGFKVREGQPIGCKVTLRGENMYNFMDKLISISLPRVRDFRGVIRVRKTTSNANTTIEKTAAQNQNIIRKWCLSILKMAEVSTRTKRLSMSKKRFVISLRPIKFLEEVLNS